MGAIKVFDEAARLRELDRYAILDTPRDGAFDDITALAALFFNVPVAIISLVDRDRIWFKSAYGLDGTQQIARGPGLCASAILADGIYVAADLRADPNSLTNPLVATKHGFRFYVAVPLRSPQGHNLGTFCLMDTVPRAFPPGDQGILERFGRLVMVQLEQRLAVRKVAALAREVGRKNTLLVHSASHDAQTGLLNRAAIQARLQTLSEALSEDQSLTALLFDVDHFKAVNDTHGHPGGDVVLAEVAKRIAAVLRPTDYVGRFGGEEFLVILADCDWTVAATIAERVRNKIAKTPIAFNGKDIWVTISAGAYVASGQTSTAGTVKAADDALYAAKRGGRNRVVFSSIYRDPQPVPPILDLNGIDAR